MTDLAAAVERLLPGVRADLERLVAIPSVSADPARRDDVRASAEAVAALLRDVGLESVEVLAVDGGAPAVVARQPGPVGTPTVLLYAHHDVQPTGARSSWRSEPFLPTERDGRLFGRGAADDKAGVMAHVAALRAFDGRPPVGVVVFVEGEEEVGSPTFTAFLEAHREALRADVIVVADSVNWAIGQPALTTGLRGLVDCVVEVATLDHAVHSGMYGGAVPDALTTLVRLLATLHDDAGDVAVPGLVQGEAPPLGDATYDARFRAEAGLLDGVETLGTGSVLTMVSRRPSLAVLAIDSPPVDDVANVLQPVARAKVSMRIAPGQDPAAALAALRDHLRAHAPWGARVTVTDGQLGAAVALEATGPAYDAARAAFAEAWGVEPVDFGIGGTIPFIAEFEHAYPDAAILVTGVEDPDSRAHGADESLHLGEFAKVCLAEALLLRNLASGPATPDSVDQEESDPIPDE